ncbi:hypothetical protein [uncultured Shewanella sp.]|uniref:hypothetical protein n=1 Tax=uncultured Shewanella sp. TaxID=173975 RepID=UPI002631E996|nr:hypothetical protein [uncultured Shewanella sp.]
MTIGISTSSALPQNTIDMAALVTLSEPCVTPKAFNDTFAPLLLNLFEGAEKGNAECISQLLQIACKPEVNEQKDLSAEMANNLLEKLFYRADINSAAGSQLACAAQDLYTLTVNIEAKSQGHVKGDTQQLPSIILDMAVQGFLNADDINNASAAMKDLVKVLGAAEPSEPSEPSKQAPIKQEPKESVTSQQKNPSAWMAGKIHAEAITKGGNGNTDIDLSIDDAFDDIPDNESVIRKQPLNSQSNVQPDADVVLNNSLSSPFISPVLPEVGDIDKLPLTAENLQTLQQTFEQRDNLVAANKANSVNVADIDTHSNMSDKTWTSFPPMSPSSNSSASSKISSLNESEFNFDFDVDTSSEASSIAPFLPSSVNKATEKEKNSQVTERALVSMVSEQAKARFEDARARFEAARNEFQDGLMRHLREDYTEEARISRLFEQGMAHFDKVTSIERFEPAVNAAAIAPSSMRAINASDSVKAITLPESSWPRAQGIVSPQVMPTAANSSFAPANDGRDQILAQRQIDAELKKENRVMDEVVEQYSQTTSLQTTPPTVSKPVSPTSSENDDLWAQNAPSVEGVIKEGISNMFTSAVATATSPFSWAWGKVTGKS